MENKTEEIGIVQNKPENTELTTPQNSTVVKKEFLPTPHMIRWYEKTVELGYKASLSEVAKESGVDRKNWYLWTRNSDFVDWWDTQWQRYLKTIRYRLNAIGMAKAEGDYQYWHDMMEITGNMQPKGPSIVSPTQVNVNLDKYIK